MTHRQEWYSPTLFRRAASLSLHMRVIIRLLDPVSDADREPGPLVAIQKRPLAEGLPLLHKYASGRLKRDLKVGVRIK